jgi:uncharacterized repeat protein (TIGR01451 family)
MIVVVLSVLMVCAHPNVLATDRNATTPLLQGPPHGRLWDPFQGPLRDRLQDPFGDPLTAGLKPGAGSMSPSFEPGEFGGIDFGEVRPSLSPYIAPMAFQLTCTSRENPIQVTIKGEDLKDEPRSIPCTRISWRMSGEPSWSQLAENPASLVVVPVGERRNICLDFKYDVLWEDPVGEYTAPVTVSFLPRAEAVLSKAAPNPFSPNGDGIKDETVIACDLTWEQDEPEAIQCILALADDGSSETIKTLEIPGVHSPGTARVTWDGTDESGCTVPDGYYRYSFHKAGQSPGFGSGIVVVDTIPPGLTVFSPKDGEEVTSNITVSGQTESEECLVSVFIEDRLTSQARPSGDGSFSLGVAAPPGTSRFSIVSEDPAGNRSLRHIDVVNNTAVTISGPSYRETTSPLAEFNGLAPVSAAVTLAVNGNDATRVESTEQGKWAASGVRLAPGDNTVTVSAMNQRGEIVTSEAPITVRYVLPPAGSGKITGRVTDACTDEAVEGAEVMLVARENGVTVSVTQEGSVTALIAQEDGVSALIAQEGCSIAIVRTDEGGVYELDEIPSGTYMLQVSCLNYYTFETCLIRIASGEEITFDVALVPNKALDIEKSANVDACSIGDIVKYTLTVENLTDIEVNNVKVHDLLPCGIAVIPGTSQVRGKESEPEVSSGEPGLAVWAIGTLGPRETVTVSFLAAVGFCDMAGDKTNKAYATGETGSGQVKTPSSEATLFVSKGIFRDDGLIFGKAFVDTDCDGEMGIDEHGLAGARIIKEDGSEILTDASGMYSIKGVSPGFHMLILCPDSLPQGFRCDERKAFVYVAPYSIVRLDFPVTLCEPAPCDLPGDANDGRNAHDGCSAGGGWNVSNGRNANECYNANECCNAGDNCNTACAVAESCNQDPIVMVAVGEATLSLAGSTGGSAKGNLAFFMSGRIDEHHTLTCGLDLARRDPENLRRSAPGCRNRGCPDPEAFSANYGDASKVVRSLPYAGPLYVSLKGDAWEASYSTFRTDFIKSDLAPYKRVLPGAIIRYEKDNLTATCFDSTPCTTTGRVQGGAFEAQVSPKLTLGGGFVRHRESQGAVCVYSAYGQYLSGEDFSAYCELGRSSGGSAGEGLCIPTGSGALSLRCMKRLGPLSLEARYKAAGPYFFRFVEPDASELSHSKLSSMEPYAAEFNRVQVKPDTSDFGLKATISPVTGRLPRLGLSGEARVVRENISRSREGIPSRNTAYELAAVYALGDSSIIAADVRHATTVAEARSHVAASPPPMMTDKSFGINVKGRMLEAVLGSLGMRWGERTDFQSSPRQVGYNQLKAEAKGAIARDLSVSLNCEATFESEDSVPVIPVGRLSTKLGIGIDWTMSPYLRSRAKVSSSSSGGAALALRMAYKPSSRLEAALRWETVTKTGKSKVAFEADANPIPGLSLTVSFDREGNWHNRTCLGYELGFTWRPVFPSKLMAFGGIKGKEAATGTRGEFCRVLTGQVGMALAIDPVTDVSARCVLKRVSEGSSGAGAGAHVETGLATFRITRRLDTGKCGIDRRYEIDVACESSLYFIDIDKQRKTESAIEVGIPVSENVRFALGYKWTKFRHGIMSEAACAGDRVYVRLGLGWATGI